MKSHPQAKRQARNVLIGFISIVAALVIFTITLAFVVHNQDDVSAQATLPTPTVTISPRSKEKAGKKANGQKVRKFGMRSTRIKRIGYDHQRLNGTSNGNGNNGNGGSPEFKQGA